MFQTQVDISQGFSDLAKASGTLAFGDKECPVPRPSWPFWSTVKITR